MAADSIPALSTPATCSDDGGDHTEEIDTALGDRYYLVVPAVPDSEGSYGTDSAGVERPPAILACEAAQDVTPCPEAGD